MRVARIALTAFLSVVFLAACDTTQPLGFESAMARVDYSATVAPLKIYDVYTAILVDTDNPPDQIPDEKRVLVQGTFPAPVCEEVVPNQFRNAPKAWPFAVEISIVPRNSFDARVIESTQTPGGRFGFARATPGDTESTPLPDRPIDPPLFVAGGRAVAYTDGLRVSAGSNLYVENCTSVGPGGVPAYRASSFELKPGDLIRVTIRPLSAGLESGQTGEFNVSLAIDGTAVGVTGQTASLNFAEGIAFTYLFE